MKAIVHERFGAPRDVLRIEEVETPTLEPGSVLIRVEAVAVAKGDWLISHGLPYIARPSYGFRSPKDRIPGLEVAGVVESVGDEGSDFAPGDRVFGWTKGALAEMVAVPASQLTAIPDGVSFEQAAALPISGFTALQAVRDSGEVGPGDRVLVIGASGGVGSFAVQIAKAFGAEVTGVASTRNLDLVRELGADHVVDYTTEEITDGDREYDVVIDIAGNRSIRSLRRALVDGGTLVIVGGSGGRFTMGFGRTVRAVLTSPFVKEKLTALISKPNGDDLAVLAGLAGSGKITPAVGETYPLAEAASAIELVGAGRSAGKTVVTLS